MKKIIMIAMLALVCGVSNAQLVYQNSCLSFEGPIHNGTYKTSWHGWAHAWIDIQYPDRYLTMVVSTLDPRIASASGKISFFSDEHGYNSIQVSETFTASDVRLKSNIQSLKNTTETLRQLRPVTYSMIKAKDLSKTNSCEYGFVAQEVEEILPDIVTEDDKGLKLVNYTAIIPILTATIQELVDRIETLERQVNELSK